MSLATNSHFYFLYLWTLMIKPWYFKLRWSDPTEYIVWNIRHLLVWVKKHCRGFRNIFIIPHALKNKTNLGMTGVRFLLAQCLSILSVLSLYIWFNTLHTTNIILLCYGNWSIEETDLMVYYFKHNQYYFILLGKLIYRGNRPYVLIL